MTDSSQTPGQASGQTPGNASTFDMGGIRRGAVGILPVALGVVVYGMVYGMLAGQAGMTLAEAAAMSAFVFAGASQFVVLDMWTHPLPVTGLIITVLIVNLRHVLMGAAVAPLYARATPLQAYASMFFMVDESWAMTMAESSRRETSASFMMGAGFTLWLSWFCATLTGYLAGGLIPDPARYGLDFAFTAAFLALLAGMWRGKGDIPIWLVAAVVALVASLVLPGKWYILVGGIAGGIVGAVKGGGSDGN